MRVLISAALIVRNEAENLLPCLESLRGWVDEVVVVDGESTDGTVEVAKRFGAKVFVRPPRDAIDEDRPFAVKNCKGEWVFHIDADEVVPPRLGQALRQAAERGEADAFEVPETSWFLGEPCNVWKGRKARLFRKDRLEVSSRIHGMYRLAPGTRMGRIKVDPGQEIQHYWTDGLGQLLRRLDRYTSIEASQAGSQPVRGLKRRTLRAFLGAYLADGGWRKGSRGFYLSLHHAFYRASAEMRRVEIAQGGAEAIRKAYRTHAMRLATGSKAGMPPP